MGDTATTATSCWPPSTSSKPVELIQRAFHLAATWRNPVVVMGDYYLAHTAKRCGGRRTDRSRPVPRRQRLAMTGKSGETGRAKLVCSWAR